MSPAPQGGGSGLDRRRFLTAVTAATAALPLGEARAQQTPPDPAPPDPRALVATTLRINGEAHRLALDPRASLLDTLRERIGLTGSKKGCDQGQCGACTVLVDGKRVLSCLTLALSVRGEVTTIEGLAEPGGALHPMQQAFIDQDGFQCGYCTPGQILSAIACVNEGHAGTPAEIREYMSGNLCRCAAYPNIVLAVEQAKSQMREPDMRPFVYEQATSLDAAVKAAAMPSTSGSAPASSAAGMPVHYLAGGTTLIDLMKLDVMRPERVVDINPLDRTGSLGKVEVSAQGLRLGGLVRMADAARHPDILRDYPVVAQTLTLAASPQLRNMATLAGNVLQRTRCPYFRDTRWRSCNKREPGSGCSALDGYNRQHAILGGSPDCIALYPGDFAQALIALDATVEVAGAAGTRTLPFADLHRRPEKTPDVETTLRPADLITALVVPPGPWTRRSLYLKVRDRESYEFALASAAVALDIRDGVVAEARIGLGGVAAVPWRAREAEAALKGRRLDEAAASQAAEAAFAAAAVREHNAYKVPLGKATLVRALLQAGSLEV